MDFTSSLYFGLTHPSTSLAGWRQLTTGVPAAVFESGRAVALARDLAALIGGEGGMLFPSTLHAFLDLFTRGLPRAVFLWDRALYPVARWGIELAAARGAPSSAFAHLGEGVDEAWVRRQTPPGFMPVLVTDGFCAGCGRAAPLRQYLEWVADDGWVVVDDTQALGLLGAGPSRGAPFGRGGGGSLRHQGVGAEGILIVASLAKAFGVPLTTVVGPASFISALRSQSEMRAHTSPVSAALIEAANAALRCNQLHGAHLRERLVANIEFFRRGLVALGLRASGGLFPLQSLTWADADAVSAIHRRLSDHGVRTVMTQGSCRKRRSLTFIIRADQSVSELEAALDMLRVVSRTSSRHTLQGAGS